MLVSKDGGTQWAAIAHWDSFEEVGEFASFKLPASEPVAAAWQTPPIWVGRSCRCTSSAVRRSVRYPRSWRGFAKAARCRAQQVRARSARRARRDCALDRAMANG